MGYIFQTNRYLILKRIEKNAHFVTGRVLDVGCGPMSRYRHLFDCSEYVKMDIAPGENVDVVGTAEAIPFPDESFDSIVCTETINDVFEPVKAFAEFNRTLRKGGIILITCPSIAKQTDSATDYWRFTRHSLRKLAEDSGFTVEVLEQRGAYWSTMAQLSIAYWILKLHVYDKWYERLFGIGASLVGKLSISLDQFEKSVTKTSFTNGYLMIARKN